MISLRRALARRPSRRGRRMASPALAAAALLFVGGGAGAVAAGYPPPWESGGPDGGGGPVLADPGHPGRLLLFVAEDGAYASDTGARWTPAEDVTGDQPVLFAPSDPTVAYRVEDYHLSVSHDGGATWTPQPATVGNPMAISPTDPHTIYGDVFTTTTGSDDLAVSHDEGATWTPIDHTMQRPDDGTGLYHLFVDPLDETHIIAGTVTGEWETTDSGARWRPYPISLVEAEPLAPTHWIGVEVSSQTPMISLDAGLTWRAMGPVGLPLEGYVHASPAKAGLLYVLARDPIGVSNGFAVLMRSTDDGRTWERRGPTPTPTAYRWDQPIWFDPGDADRLFMVNPRGDLERSQDAGLTWSLAVHGVPDGSVDALATSPLGGGIALAVVDGAPSRLEHTTDGGAHWHRVDTPPGNPMDVAFVSNGDAFLTTFANNNVTLYRSQDGGPWQALRDLGSNACRIAPSSGSVVYLDCTAGLLRTEDGGATWTTLPARPAHLGRLIVDPANPDVLIAGGRDWLDRSTDGGRTWQPVLDGVEAAAFSPRDGSLYVVQDDAGTWRLYRTTDLGQTLQLVRTPGIPGAIAIGRNGVLYVASLDPSGETSVQATDNDGVTWSDLGTGRELDQIATSGTGSGRLWAYGKGVHSRRGVPFDAPRLAGAFTIHLARGPIRLTGRRRALIPLMLRWPAATVTRSTICGYTVTEFRQRGTTTIRSGLQRTTARVWVGTGEVNFRVQAVACSGAVSVWLQSPGATVHLHDDAARAWVTAGARWRRVAARRALGGTQLVAPGGGARLRLAGDESVSEIAYVASTGPHGGWPVVRLDGGEPRTVSLRSPVRRFRRIVYVGQTKEPAAVRLTVRSGGGPGALTAVDAFVTLSLSSGT